MKVITADKIENLDDIPLPARDLVDMKDYNLMQNNKRTATLITSRGCEGNCVYCSRKAMGNKFRPHSAERILLEILYLKGFGYESFYFLDDNFAFDRKRVIDIADMIVENKLNISFRITSRADCLDYEVLYRLKKAGLEVVSLGIEHADNEILKKAGKQMTIEDNERIVKYCKDLNIKVKGFFIINLPGAKWG
jgi:radical SAM superfamily enzyme YgiQ (UPF0313 family)